VTAGRSCIFTAEDAEDAKNCFGSHPVGLFRHDIQTPRCFEKKPETTETA